MLTSPDDGPPPTAVIVARHGERHDYNCILAGTNWVATAERPWDPPLSEYGHEQGRQLGRRMQQVLKEQKLAPLTAIYSSPLLRCRQTAVAAASASTQSKVRVEPGLAESMNEHWYRSWSLPNSDGTWGFKGVVNVDTLKEPAKRSVLDLLKYDDNTIEGVDEEYQSLSTVSADYCWGNFESSQNQRERMYKVMEDLARRHPGETVMLVSHGGPVTHLYQQLTEKDWWVHGEAAYASFSVYSKDEKRKSWKPHIINESSYLHEH